MKILMLVPYAFFRPSGSSLSTYYRIKALVDLGNNIDVLVFPFGKDIVIRNTKIIRSPKVPFISKLNTGRVLPKIPLSVAMTLRCLQLLKNKKYDIIYTHGTSGLIGVLMKTLYNSPLVQDMHGLWEHEIIKWNFYPSKIVFWFTQLFENLIIRNSDIIVCTCRNITERVKGISKGKPVFTIENTAEETTPDANQVDIRYLKEKFRIGNQKVIMYTGTFLKIQNIDWLIECLASITKIEKNVLCFLIGGTSEEVVQLQMVIDSKGLSDHFFVLTRKTKGEIVKLMNLADILVSPRTIGIEIPLKIITYLQSGKAIVATNCPIHNQILNDEIALLTELNIDSFTKGIKELLDSEKMRLKLGINARKTYMKMYSYTAYKNKMENLCLSIMRDNINGENTRIRQAQYSI